MVNKNDTQALARKQLDRKLTPLRGQAAFVRPPKGWVRAIRDALGMNGRQFAARLGIKQPTVIALEKGEIAETITLGRLRELAEGLDCSLVYTLIPNKPLQDIVEDRAREVANARLQRTHHSMRLEDQALENEDLIAERNRIAAELIRNQSKQLWDKEKGDV